MVVVVVQARKGSEGGSGTEQDVLEAYRSVR